jgi:hypothetical protein
MAAPVRAFNTTTSLMATLAVVVLVYVVFIRPWHMRWGAMDMELLTPLPGDPLIPPSSVISTRAVTIHAPAAEVWRWLVQIGQGRGGFYSYTWLENLFAAEMENAEEIVPELQHLKVGDSIVYQKDGPYGKVSLIGPERYISIGGWTFALRPINHNTTRLIVRYFYDYSDSFLELLYYYTIFEPAHFIMESGMMLGIKQRAELAARIEKEGFHESRPGGSHGTK